MVILPIITIVLAYLIAKTGFKTGIFFVAGIIGLSLSIIALFFPAFGFYYVIILTFFLFDIKRMIDVDIPLGTLIDILILITFIGIVIRKLAKKEAFWKNCDHILVYAYLISFLYSVIEIFNPNAGSGELVLIIFRRYLTLQIFLYCSIQLFPDIASINRFFMIFFGLATLAAMYGCYQEWFGYPKYELDYIFSSQLLVGLYSLDNGNFRKFSFLSDPTSFGILMAAMALISIVMLRSTKGNVKKIAVITGLTFFLLSMGYSGTRTAYAIFVAGIVLFILMTLTNRNTLIFAALSFIAFVVIIFGPIYGNATINRIRTTFEFSEDASYQVRDINRHSIQPYLQSHPIGGGIGSTGVLNMEQNSDHPLAGFPTDSGFLRAALELGWIGLIIHCALYFMVLQQGVRTYYGSKNRYIKTVVLACTVAIFCYVVAHYAQIAIGPLPGSFLFYSMIAIIIRLKQIEHSETPHISP
jgi:O-antigen ligase/polysaccharide polymerase Wzy-like membrane protein